MRFGTTVALALALATVGTAGCSAESVQDLQEETEVVATTTSALALDYLYAYGLDFCSGVQDPNRVCPSTLANAKTGMKNATALLRYMQGNPTYPGPTTAGACGRVKTTLDAIRSEVQASTLRLDYDHTGHDVGCHESLEYNRHILASDLNTTATDEYGATSQNTSLVSPLFASKDTTYWTNLMNDVTSCYGASTKYYLLLQFDAAKFMVPGSSTPQCRVFAIYVDPEPASLNAPLSNTSGAAAAATYTNTLTGTTARYFSSSGTYTQCGGASQFVGYPCSPNAASAGTTLNTTLYSRLVGTTPYCTCKL